MSTMTIDQRLGMEIHPRVVSLRVLDFDSECRPIAWYGGDWVTKQPTAIAWKFTDEKGPPNVAVIGESFDARNVLEEEEEMLRAFVHAYNKADVVTGHYIRGFDLPLLNGALIRLGMDQLKDKLTQCTKADFVKAQGISKSQENLGAMFDLKHPKIPMNTSLWMRANLLMPDGIEAAKRRVIGDVRQHIEMRQAMLSYGLLRSPVVWSALASASASQYQP